MLTKKFLRTSSIFNLKEGTEINVSENHFVPLAQSSKRRTWEILRLLK